MTDETFKEALERGEKYEALLDEYYNKKGFEVKAPEQLQYLGADRLFKTKYCRFLVEYKADETAGKTGNFFIEIWSDIEQEKPGWACTSLAQVLIYYIPDWKTAFWLNMAAIRFALPMLNKTCQKKDCHIDFHSQGLLVPINSLHRSNFIRVDKIDEEATEKDRKPVQGELL
jgi:hypothetical protein